MLHFSSNHSSHQDPMEYPNEFLMKRELTLSYISSWSSLYMNIVLFLMRKWANKRFQDTFNCKVRHQALGEVIFLIRKVHGCSLYLKELLFRYNDILVFSFDNSTIMQLFSTTVVDIKKEHCRQQWSYCTTIVVYNVKAKTYVKQITREFG